MDPRSSIRYGVLAREIANFQANQLPFQLDAGNAKWFTYRFDTRYSAKEQMQEISATSTLTPMIFSCNSLSFGFSLFRMAACGGPIAARRRRRTGTPVAGQHLHVGAGYEWGGGSIPAVSRSWVTDGGRLRTVGLRGGQLRVQADGHGRTNEGTGEGEKL